MQNFHFAMRNIQGISELCIRNVTTGRGYLSKQISPIMWVRKCNVKAVDIALLNMMDECSSLA